MLAGAAAALAVAMGASVYHWRKRPPDPDEIERQRRSYINQVGRIVEGHVIELVEAPPPPLRRRGFFHLRGAAQDQPPNSGRKLVCYSYSISGVSYETAQDITGLEERAHLDHVAAGQPASVKYDPSNPSNSILMADDWSGLR